MARWLSLVVLCGCVGTGKIDEAPADEEAPAAASPAGKTVVVAEVDPQRVMIPGDGKQHTYNVTLETDDLVRAAERARAVADELGAEMVNVNSGPTYANLNARAEPGQCKLLPHAVRQLGYRVQSENVGANDLAPQLRQLQRRLARLDRADTEARRIIRGVADQETVDGVLILTELANNERQNLTQQIENYAAQAQFCQIYINFTVPQPTY